MVYIDLENVGDGTRVIFGRMNVVGIVLLRKHLQNCIVLVGRGSLQCWRLCGSLMGGCIGTFSFVVHCRIGS